MPIEKENEQRIQKSASQDATQRDFELMIEFQRDKKAKALLGEQYLKDHPEVLQMTEVEKATQKFINEHPDIKRRLSLSESEGYVRKSSLPGGGIGKRPDNQRKTTYSYEHSSNPEWRKVQYSPISHVLHTA